MGIFQTLFSSEDTISKTTDAVISAGDKLFYTDEEKADMKIKMREMHIETLKAYSPFKIAQRVLAIWYSLLFGIAFIIGLAMSVFNIYAKYNGIKHEIPPDKIAVLDITPLFTLMEAFALSWIVLTIVAFYFAGGSIESFRGIKK